MPDEPWRRRRPLAQHRVASRLNPAGERKVERFGWTFAPGDKVMQIENDYDKEVYNGDIGYPSVGCAGSSDNRDRRNAIGVSRRTMRRR